MDKARRFFQETRKGSFTVEAAFVIPAGIALVFLILWMAMFLHDEVVVKAWLCDQVQKQAFQKEADGKETGPETLLSDIETVRKTEGDRFVISCRGKGRFLSFLEETFFSLKEPDHMEEKETGLLFGEEIVRKSRF